MFLIGMQLRKIKLEWKLAAENWRIVSLHKLKLGFTASKWQYTAAGRAYERGYKTYI